jgi:hypothetical protein
MVAAGLAIPVLAPGGFALGGWVGGGMLVLLGAATAAAHVRAALTSRPAV